MQVGKKRRLAEFEQETKIVEFKPKPGHPEALVTVNFPQTKPLQSLLDVLASVLSDCNFEIHLESKRVDGGAFSGLTAKCMDDAGTSIVLCKLYGNVVKSAECKDAKWKFTVGLPILLSHVKTLDGHFYTQMYMKKNAEGVFFNSYSNAPTNRRQFQHFQIDLKEEDRKQNIDFDISAIEYDFNVQFSLSELKKIIRLSKAVGGDNMRLRLLEPKQKHKDGLIRRILIVHLYGTSSYREMLFMSISEKSIDVSTENTIIMTSTKAKEETDDPRHYKLSELEEVYNAVFLVDNLNRFVKNLDGNTVMISIKPEKPMIFNCSLGDEQSFVAFFLAPRIQDDSITNIVTSLAP